MVQGVIVCRKFNPFNGGGVEKSSPNRAFERQVIDSKPVDLPMAKVKFREIEMKA